MHRTHKSPQDKGYLNLRHQVQTANCNIIDNKNPKVKRPYLFCSFTKCTNAKILVPCMTWMTWMGKGQMANVLIPIIKRTNAKSSFAVMQSTIWSNTWSNDPRSSQLCNTLGTLQCFPDLIWLFLYFLKKKLQKVKLRRLQKQRLVLSDTFFKTLLWSCQSYLDPSVRNVFIKIFIISLSQGSCVG